MGNEQNRKPQSQAEVHVTGFPLGSESRLEAGLSPGGSDPSARQGALCRASRQGGGGGGVATWHFRKGSRPCLCPLPASSDPSLCPRELYCRHLQCKLGWNRQSSLGRARRRSGLHHRVIL